jgi:hypothetical protein
MSSTRRSAVTITTSNCPGSTFPDDSCAEAVLSGSATAIHKRVANPPQGGVDLQLRIFMSAGSGLELELLAAPYDRR